VPARASSRRCPVPGLCAFTALLAVLLLQFGAGCSQQAAIERYIPSGDASRTAMISAFDAWKQGVPAGPVPDTSPLIHVTDNHRRPKEILVGYRILGEVPGDTPRCYAVELTFDPPREERARFVVVGIDPLWVFRLEDYQLLAHWEHKMDKPSPAAPRP
jgi:hypothetical protein